MPFLGLQGLGGRLFPTPPITAAPQELRHPLGAAPPGPSALGAPVSGMADVPLPGSNSVRVAGGGQVPERAGRFPGASFWLPFSSRSHRRRPGCSRPWPRSGGEAWVWSAGRAGTEQGRTHTETLS